MIFFLIILLIINQNYTATFITCIYFFRPNKRVVLFLYYINSTFKYYQKKKKFIILRDPLKFNRITPNIVWDLRFTSAPKFIKSSVLASTDSTNQHHKTSIIKINTFLQFLFFNEKIKLFCIFFRALYCV